MTFTFLSCGPASILSRNDAGPSTPLPIPPIPPVFMLSNPLIVPQLKSKSSRGGGGGGGGGEVEVAVAEASIRHLL